MDLGDEETFAGIYGHLMICAVVLDFLERVTVRHRVSRRSEAVIAELRYHIAREQVSTMYL